MNNNPKHHRVMNCCDTENSPDKGVESLASECCNPLSCCDEVNCCEEGETCLAEECCNKANGCHNNNCCAETSGTQACCNDANSTTSKATSCC